MNTQTTTTYKPGDVVRSRIGTGNLFQKANALVVLDGARSKNGYYHAAFWNGTAWQSAGEMHESWILGYAVYTGTTSYEGFYLANGLVTEDGSIDHDKASAFLKTHRVSDDGKWIEVA